MNLGYPGGPIIDRLAQHGVNHQIRFTKAKLKSNYDFSFSGLKTAVLYYTQKNKDYLDSNSDQKIVQKCAQF